MNVKYCSLALLLSLVSTLTIAEGVPIEPGQWEMTSTMNMPMMPQPRVSTRLECIEENELSPDTMNEEDMDPNCTVESRLVDGNTMAWSMECNAAEGASRGEWEATSHGDTLTGEGTVTVDMGGQEMVMTMKWDGKRVGDCD